MIPNWACVHTTAHYSVLPMWKQWWCRLLGGGGQGGREGVPQRKGRVGAAKSVLCDGFPGAVEDWHWRRARVSGLIPLLGENKGMEVPRSAFGQGGRQVCTHQPSSRLPFLPF